MRIERLEGPSRARCQSSCACATMILDRAWFPPRLWSLWMRSTSSLPHWFVRLDTHPSSLATRPRTNLPLDEWRTGRSTATTWTRSFSPRGTCTRGEASCTATPTTLSSAGHDTARWVSIAPSTERVNGCANHCANSTDAQRNPPSEPTMTPRRDGPVAEILALPGYDMRHKLNFELVQQNVNAPSRLSSLPSGESRLAVSESAPAGWARGGGRIQASVSSPLV